MIEVYFLASLDFPPKRDFHDLKSCTRATATEHYTDDINVVMMIMWTTKVKEHLRG